jgi:hypothetical protein
LSYSRKQPQNQVAKEGGLYSKITLQRVDRVGRTFRKSERGRAEERCELRMGSWGAGGGELFNFGLGEVESPAYKLPGASYFSNLPKT